MKLVVLTSAVLAVINAGFAAGEILTLWPHDETKVHSDARRELIGERISNPRLAGLSHAHFFSADSELYSEISATREIEFGIPTRNGNLIRKTCFLRSGVPVVPRTLQNKYSEQIKLFNCATADNEQLNIVIDTTRPDGLSATFFSRDRRTFYVDSVFAESSHYVIYDTEVAGREGVPPVFENNLFEDPELLQEMIAEAEAGERMLPRGTGRLLANTFPVFKFKLAPLANSRYSNFHGNTVESVLAQIIVCFTRVNGVYQNELGTFFELAENADLGICLQGDSRSACQSLGNSANVINSAMSTLNSLGVDSESYDIGHVLTTGSGGLASLGSLCHSRNKAKGTTGLPEPWTDKYYVDYVAHEIGHQAYGGHSFRDCNGPTDGNLMKQTAVEPGSASSIMGYAGICGNNNIQSFSDPYFSALNLQQMRDFIVEEGLSGCGETFDVGPALPEVSGPAVCQVPVGNYFQLKGTSSSGADENTFFSWDRVDAGYEDFSADNLGKFRSWKPTRSMSRFLPNLHELNYPSDVTVEEVPTGPRDMTFRFVERREYKTSAVADFFAEMLMGDFAYVDTEVEFTNDPALKIISHQRGADFVSGESVVFEWSGLTKPGLTVEVLMAVNTLNALEDELFDYEVHNEELDWVLLGAAPIEDGAVSVQIPTRFGGEEVNVMVRSSMSSDAESCYFFDLVAVSQVVRGAEVAPTAGVKKEQGILLVLFACIAAVAVVAVYELKSKSGEKTQEEVVVSEQAAVEKVKPQGEAAVQNAMFQEV